MTASQIPTGIAMPCPFANPIDGTTTAVVTDVATTASEATVNFPKGFGANYAAPSSGGGKYITRGEMNGIGKALGTDVFRMKCGAINTFDQAFAYAVGGYPKGAVLQYLVGNQFFEVVSMVEGNKIDFTGATIASEYASGTNALSSGTVDGANWRYCNKDYGSTDSIQIVGSYSSTDEIAVTPVQSVSAKIIKAPISGFVTLENLFWGFGEATSVTNAQSFIGTGIICKIVSQSEVSSLSQCTSGGTADGWMALQNLQQGAKEFGGYTANASSYSVVKNFAFSFGVPSVTAGQWIAVSIVNGMQSGGYSSAYISGTFYPLTCSFDIAIIAS